jgi:hypothetical protein
MYGNLKEDHPFLPSLPLGSMPPNSVPCKRKVWQEHTILAEN